MILVSRIFLKLWHDNKRHHGIWNFSTNLPEICIEFGNIHTVTRLNWPKINQKRLIVFTKKKPYNYYLLCEIGKKNLP